MMDPETRRMIQEEVRRQLNVVLHGETDGTSGTAFTEGISKLFPGQPTITKRPVMHPYGFVSRAVKGTISVVARVGDHIGNRMVIGHRDADRPDDLKEGEAAIYSVAEYELRVLKDRIQLGKGGTWETAVLGETLTTILKAMISQTNAAIGVYNQHTHTGNLGAPTTPPLQPAQDVSVSALDNNKHLSKDGGAF